jgi:hypothetical protein
MRKRAIVVMVWDMTDVDADGSNASDGLRRGLLTRTVYEVLTSSAGPMRSADVLSRVAELIDFTERELSTNASGQVRWRTAANAAMSWSTFGGWLTRDETGPTH